MYSSQFFDVNRGYNIQGFNRNMVLNKNRVSLFSLLKRVFLWVF